MHEQIKERWLTALRSGEYKQARAALKTPLGFCCLGVLCDLYIKDGNDAEWLTNSFHEDSSDDEDEHAQDEELPDSVMKWAGLDDNDPKVVLGGDVVVNISMANDGYPGIAQYGQAVVDAHSFEQVADFIEKQF